MEKLTLLLENKLHEVTRIAKLVETLGEKYGWGSQTVFDIQLVLEEVLVNVISYAFDDQNRHKIELDLSIDDADIIIRVADDGKPFNPLDVPAPDLEKPIEQRAIGGLGIHLVRQYVDSLNYCREGNRNVLTFKKRFAGEKDSELR